MCRMAALSLGVFTMSGVAQAQHGGECADELQPILSVGDFDGDGVVTKHDKKLLKRAIKKGEYIAFFDLNADERLDKKDKKLLKKQKNKASTLLDQQLAELFWATEAYREVGAANADGFRRFTQVLQGHGQHYARLPFVPTADGGLDPNYENISDGDLVIGEPEGLNYDENGNLVAVFYYHGIDVKDWVFVNEAGDEAAIGAMFQQAVQMTMHSAMSGSVEPYLFDDEHASWHQHWGSCWDGLDYISMYSNVEQEPFFNQAMFPQECSARESENQRQGYLPGFNMLHVWLYKLNPCGLFAGTHPDVSTAFPEEPQARELSHWFSAMGLPDPYDGHGGHGGH